MKTKLIGLILLAGSSLFARSHFGVSVGVGPAYPYWSPPPIVAYAPPPPIPYYAPPQYVRPGYAWVGGYWYPTGRAWGWQSGYWARRPHPRAYWVAPRYYGGRWYRGYWR